MTGTPHSSIRAAGACAARNAVLARAALRAGPAGAALRSIRWRHWLAGAGCLVAAGSLHAAAPGTPSGAPTTEHKIKFAYPVTKDNPIGLAIEQFTRSVAEGSGGRIRVSGYPDASLGNEIQTLSSAQGGVVEMTVVSTAGAAGTVKELGLFDLPFLIQHESQADAVIDGPIGHKLLERFADKRLIGLCYLDYGFRQVTNSKHPIRRKEDFGDLKLRTLQNRIYIDTFKALGATPLPLPYPETYTALETWAIDGQESSYLVTKSSSYQDVQKYLTETRHVYLPAVVLVSRKFWDGLAEPDRSLLSQSCRSMQQYHREISRKMEKNVVQDLIRAGLKFNEIEPSERARMVQATASVVDRYRTDLGPQLVDELMATLAKVPAPQPATR